MQPSIYNGFYRRNGCPFPPLHPSLQRGLVASYAPLLGRQGNKLYDFSGYGNHADWTGFHAGSYVLRSHDGIGTLAVNFTSSSQYLTLPSRDSIEINNQSFTISAWLYTTTFSTAGAIISKLGFSGDRGPQLAFQSNSGGIVNFAISASSSTVVSFASNTLGSVGISPYPALLHIAAGYNYDTQTVVIYCNGKEILSTTSGVPATSTMNNLSPWTIGRRPVNSSPLQSPVSIASVSLSRGCVTSEQAVYAYLNGPFGPYQYRTHDYPYLASDEGFNAAWARRNTQLIGGGCL